MKLVEKCPVCNGTGQVPYGFYNPQPTYTTTTGGPVTEMCRSCQGSGIIKINPFDEEYEKLKIEYSELQKDVKEYIEETKEILKEKKSVVKEKLIKFIEGL